FSGHTSTTLPPACPEPSTFYVGTSQSEDCLWSTIYTPGSTPPTGGFPVLVWIHGGSNYFGSASAPGLDGSQLASSGNIMVVVIQYRLGVLGLVPPSQAASNGDPNLGLQDIIHALQAVNEGISVFGGDPSKVTVGGESSGAQMIRALLGAPSAAGLFRAAILQSDPMIYGFASSSLTTQLQSYVYSLGSLGRCTDLSCLQALSVEDVLSAQTQLNQMAPYMITGVPFSEVMRPTYGTPTLPADPTESLFGGVSTLSTSNIPLLITTVRNEGGQAVSQLFSSPISPNNNTYLYTLAALVGTGRAGQIVNSASYALPASAPSGSDIFREKFELATTDGTWRCPNRQAAALWAGTGANVWVGEWEAGETYPTNAYGGYCTSKGRVCHEDDIFPSFGTNGANENLVGHSTSFYHPN
ncbi:Alpha/Beta hydrolase protein, partial [Kockovaella imperatae]